MTGARVMRYWPGKVRKVVSRTRSARDVLGPLEPGLRLTGVTGGQFSSVNAIEHMVEQLGPARVMVSTWSTGIRDVAAAERLSRAGDLLEFRVLVGFFTRTDPRYADNLMRYFGRESFRHLQVHAKVNIVLGERGSAVMRSSMNLNRNPRTENFDIDVDDEVAQFYAEWFEALWDAAGRSQTGADVIRRAYEVLAPREAKRPVSGRATQPAAREAPAAAPARLEDMSLSAAEFDALLEGL